MHAHARSLLHVSQMMSYALDHEPFQAFSRLFFLSFWCRLILISAVQRMLFQKWSDFFLEFFWQSLIWPCLDLVVLPLYSLWWSLLLIVDFDSGTSASWRVFFSWLDIVKGFFFTMERILWSSITVVCGRPGLLCCKAHQCCLSSSECNKLMIWPLLMFLLFLWGICFVLKPNNRLFHLYGELLWLREVGSQQQLPRVNGTLRINSRPLPA